MQDLTVKTVDRVAAILHVLSTGGDEGVSVTDMTVATGLSKATVHRLLGALVSVGYAFQQFPERNYRLGARAVALGGAALRHHSAGLVQPILRRIADETGDTVFASVREGLAAICVARAVGTYPIRTLTLDVRDRRPLGVGAGSLALLAAMSDGEIDAILRQNENWLRDFQAFDRDSLLALVARTRKDGYALNEGRIVPGMCALGVVARDPDGRPFVALSLAAIKDRMGDGRIAEIVRLLQAEAHRLEADLASPLPATGT